jgi:hypothetical protein
MGCDTTQFKESPTFWGNMLLLSSGLKSKPSKKVLELGCKSSWAVSELHGVITQKAELFRVTTVRISNTILNMSVTETEDICDSVDCSSTQKNVF